MSAVLDYLPRGNTLSDEAWQRRHLLLQGVLALHLPLLFAFGLSRGFSATETAEGLAAPLACLVLGRLLRSRRPASLFITLGLVYCSAALVGFSDGAIEAHFHFFIIIGFIALYQDWVPFLLNILFTVLSHGIGSSLVPDLMFNHPAAQSQPWTWSLIHGVAVLAACVGVVLFWRTTEEEQQRSLRLTEQLSAAELSRRRFTSDLLVNLARRNQNLLARQLGLLNQLEDKEHDPDALADLFRLDHLATRIRRNAESLLVLSGEESPRTWRGPVPLVDVVRAAIAEIEDLDRVDFAVDESLAVSGRGVADLTHLLAELLENAVRFSPPGVAVMLRSRPYQQGAGAQVITIEDWGVGMTPAELADINDLLRRPRDVDLSVSQRLGLHVVGRLAHRYGIKVELTQTPGGGVTAVVLLPRGVFATPGDPIGAAGAPAPSAARPAERPVERAGRPAGPPSAVLPATDEPGRRPAPVAGAAGAWGPVGATGGSGGATRAGLAGPAGGSGPLDPAGPGGDRRPAAYPDLPAAHLTDGAARPGAGSDTATRGPDLAGRGADRPAPGLDGAGRPTPGL
ncbi:MAG TPA: sensor histidine kinase, partial [Mycobacteriales bacterium]|nr:sensor histidine kinase [Mycobacteriales bacterium]